MAHGDADVVKDEDTDVIISPPITITTNSATEAGSKKGKCPEGGKSNLLSTIFRCLVAQ
jgi:hypothetical protein